MKTTVFVSTTIVFISYEDELRYDEDGLYHNEDGLYHNEDGRSHNEARKYVLDIRIRPLIFFAISHSPIIKVSWNVVFSLFSLS